MKKMPANRSAAQSVNKSATGVIAKQTAGQIPLPKVRHLPGVNARPTDNLLESVAAMASSVTTDATAPDNTAWHYGIQLFNAAYYWETHEVLESVWLKALPNSRERFLLQAVIHMTNASLKAELGKHRAATRLVTLALASLERASLHSTGMLMGLDLNQLAAVAEHCSESCGVIEWAKIE